MIECRDAPTAAVLIIGDEILSGRTKDKNIGFIADTLTDIGIDLEEVRIVADREEAIVEAVRALSGALRFRLHQRRHRPDPRRHHRRLRSPRRSAFRSTSTSAPSICCCRSGRPRHRAEREPAAHGAHSGGRTAHPEFRLGGAGLRREERLRHGRRAGDHAGDDGRGGEDAAGLARRCSRETIEAQRGEGDIAVAGRRPCRRRIRTCGSAPIPIMTAKRFTTRLVLRSRDKDALARRRRRRWTRRARRRSRGALVGG